MWLWKWRWRGIYEVYIDVLALHNFILDLAAFLAVRLLLKRCAKAARILSGAAAGTAAGCLAFVFCGNTAAYLLLMHFVINPIVLYFVFRQKDKRVFFADWGVSYAVFLFMGGVMEWMYEGAGIQAFAPAALITLLFLAMILLQGIKRLKKRLCCMEVWLFQNGRKLCLQALSDTGNLLREPYESRAVSIIDRSVYEAAFGRPQGALLIPYESLGRTDGLLETVSIEELHFIYGSRTQRVGHAAIGLADHALFYKKPYQMILNPQELVHYETTSGR